MDDVRNDDHGHGPDDARTDLIGRNATAVPGRFGDPFALTHAVYSRGGGKAAPTRPLFLCLHGWGSNENDLANIMRYIAPFNDFASLRAPYVLQSPEAGGFGAAEGAYSWFHDSVPIGEDLDYDAFAAASAIDTWVHENVAPEREVVPIGFSQGGLLAIHLLRLNPQRYRAAVSLSGFLAPGEVPGTAPADAQLADYAIPVFYGYGKNDNVLPKYELFGASAWLQEHTWLESKSYHALDHAVNLEELGDVRQWTLQHDLTSGVM